MKLIFQIICIILFSYRIEAALPDVEFEVSFDITPFENTAMDSQEKIDAKYSITNQSLNFPYNLKSENVYTGKHPVSWGIDYDCNHTLKVALSSELQLPSAKTDNGNASLKSSIKAVSEESHETNGSWLGVRCNNTEYLKNSFSDVWIARGAITMAINRDAYLKASNGRYEATVTARLEVVN